MNNSNETLLRELVLRIETLEARVSHLAQEVSATEAYRGFSGSGSSESSAPTSAEVTNPTRYSPTDPPDLPSASSAKFLGSVGVLFFILAGGYFIRLAIAQGWLTPTMQLMAVVTLALTLIGAGFLLRERDSNYASLLPAAGIALLYMAAYGGHLYFKLYDLPIANFYINAVSICCVALFASFRHQFYALIACCGTYLVPLVLGQETWSFLPVCIYLSLWNIAFGLFAWHLKSRLLLSLTAYLAIFSFGLINNTPQFTDATFDQTLVVVFQALQFLYFCGMLTWYSIRNREPLSQSEAWALSPLLCLFYLSEYKMLLGINPALAPWCAVAFAVWIYAVYQFAQRHLQGVTLHSFPMIACFIAVVGVHALYGALLPSVIKPWFSIGLVVLIAYARGNALKFFESRAVVWIFGWVIFIEYARVFCGSIPTASPLHDATLNCAFAVAMFMPARSASRYKTKLSSFLGFLSVAQLLLGFHNISVGLVPPAAVGFTTSLLWCSTALVFLLLAKRGNNHSLAESSLWLFAVTAIKVLFVDTADSGTLTRVVALLVIGSLFYAGGYVYRQLLNVNK